MTAVAAVRESSQRKSEATEIITEGSVEQNRSVPHDGICNEDNSSRPSSIFSQPSKPVTLALRNLSFFVRPVRWYHRVLKTGLAEKHNAFATDSVSRESSNASVLPDEVQLLKNINLIVKPGELVAIMGPSGSGKTTLLGAIAGKAKGRLEGDILFNGQNLKARRLKGNVTMLGCQDKMLPFLNVEQTLLFSALLKMPGASMAERRRKISEVIEELSLMHVAKTRIGNSARKGLSTGELRRTSIAQELIANPSLLLLDEPTSGLDAVLAYELMQVLRRIAVGGRAVVCAIHQPRSLSFYLAHKVVIMSQGRIIYAGPPTQVKKFFSAALGPNLMPTDLNIADTVIDVASSGEGDNFSPVGTDSKTQSSKTPSLATIIRTAYENSDMINELDTQLQAETERPVENLARQSRYPVVQWLMEIVAVFYRSFMNSFQNPWGILSSVLIQLATGCLLGSIFLRLPKKYLPAHHPVDIGDENSGAMKMLDAKWVHFAVSGIDGNGTNPFVDMVVNGVDGNQSKPLETLLQSRVPYYLGNMMPCTHKRMLLESTPGYMPIDLSEYYHRWGGQTATEVSVASHRRNDNSDVASPMGTSSMPGVVSNILMSLEVADYALYRHDWYNSWRVCRGPRSLAALTICYPAITAANNFLAPADECVGLPPIPYGLIYTMNSDQIRKYDTDTEHELIRPADDLRPYPPGFELTHPNKFKQNKGALPPFGWRRNMKNHIQQMRKNKKSNVEAADHVGVADRASAGGASGSGRTSRRSLQASALVGAGSGDFLSVLPKRLQLLKPAFDGYLVSLRKCQHPICKKFIRRWDGKATDENSDSENSNSSSSSAASSVLDYAAVLGAVINLAGCLFFASANIGFASYDGIVTICEERPLVNKEIGNRAYRPATYFIGKCAADFIFQLLPLAAGAISFYYVVGFEWGLPHVHRCGGFFGICVAIMFAAYGFSYMVAALCPSMETAVVAAPMLIVILICCSGFFVRDSAIPVWMSWCKYISIYRWGFFALCLNQFHRGESYWGLPNSFNLALIGITETQISKCIGVLIGLGIAFRLIAIIALKTLHKNEGLE